MNTIYGTDAYQKAIDFFYKQIKFDCNFEDNKCEKFKKEFYEASDRPIINCCCSDCYSSYGYLHEERIKDNLISYYEDLFNKKTGFWRKNIGCILPRKFRSATCNFFICRGLIDKFNDKYYTRYTKIIDLIRDYIYTLENSTDKLPELKIKENKKEILRKERDDYWSSSG